MSARDHWLRHQAAQRRMQSGVASDIGIDGPEEPKHLRVGINSALVDTAALVQLLIRKGLVTEEEVAAAMADGMEAEVKRYEERLAKKLGGKVTLGECGSIGGAG